MRKNKYINLIIVLVFMYSPIAKAKIPWVEVDVVKIEAQRATVDGDHLYFYVTEYPSEGFSGEVRIPSFPMHWISKEVKNITQVKLWEGALPKGNNIRLVISLMNQMIPLMLSDELIGTMQVEVTNNNNKISSVWSQPELQDDTKVYQPNLSESRFIIYGDISQYAVTFKVRVLN